MANNRSLFRPQNFLLFFYILFFLHSFDLGSRKWIAMTLVLYSIPLLLQFSKRLGVRVLGGWLGFFFMAQTALSWYVTYKVSTFQDYRTNEKNKTVITEYIGEGLPGVSGVQVVTTDQMGFRTTKPIDYEHKKGLRVFAIGGSTTEQITLDDKKTWTHLLQENLEKVLHQEVEVINTGLSGAKTRHHLATLKHILPYQPDLIIFLVGINDWNLHIREQFKDKVEFIPQKFWFGKVFFCERSYLRNTIMGRAMFRLYLHLLKRAEIKKYLKKGQKIGNTDLLVDDGRFMAAKRNSLSRPVSYSFKPTEVLPSYAEAMKEIAGICKENKVPCLFMTQPTGYQPAASEEFKKGFWQTPPASSYTLDFDSLVYIANLYNTFLIRFCKDEHVPCFDLAHYIEPSYKHMFDDCHFNIAGAQQVADVLTPVALKLLKK